jgi:hypothetical protein
MLGMDEEKLGSVFEKLFTGAYDPAEALMAQTIAMLPADIQSVLANPDALAVGTSDIRFNASAIPCENGGWAIILDRRLMAFYFVITLVLVHRVPLSAGDIPALELEDAARIAAEVAASVHEKGLPYVREFATDPARNHLASDIAAEAHRFVLSHELAHIALGHTRQKAHFVSVLVDLGIPVAEWSHDQEFDADNLALSLTLGPPPGPPAWEDLATRYAGCHLALDALAFLEDYAAEVMALPVMTTHPPAAGRLARLRAAADEACADESAREAMFVFADELARTLDMIRIHLGMLPAVPH